MSLRFRSGLPPWSCQGLVGLGVNAFSPAQQALRSANRHSIGQRGDPDFRIEPIDLRCPLARRRRHPASLGRPRAAGAYSSMPWIPKPVIAGHGRRSLVRVSRDGKRVEAWSARMPSWSPSAWPTPGRDGAVYFHRGELRYWSGARPPRLLLQRADNVEPRWPRREGDLVLSAGDLGHSTRTPGDSASSPCFRRPGSPKASKVAERCAPSSRPSSISSNARRPTGDTAEGAGDAMRPPAGGDSSKEGRYRQRAHALRQTGAYATFIVTRRWRTRRRSRATTSTTRIVFTRSSRPKVGQNRLRLRLGIVRRIVRRSRQSQGDLDGYNQLRKPVSVMQAPGTRQGTLLRTMCSRTTTRTGGSCCSPRDGKQERTPSTSTTTPGWSTTGRDGHAMTWCPTEKRWHTPARLRLASSLDRHHQGSKRQLTTASGRYAA